MTGFGPSEGNAADDRIDELIALAALGEITEAESAELDAALAGDAGLAAELDADLAVAAALQSTHAEPAPTSMKADVMAAIDALADSTDGADGADAADGADEDAADRADEDAAGTVPAPQVAPSVVGASGGVADFAAAQTARRARTGRMWQPFAAAAAVVMLLVGGVLVVGRGGSDSGPTVDAVAQAEDSQRRSLVGDLDGELDVYYSASQSAFVLVGTDVPVLTDDETYQLWFVDDTEARSVGLFRPQDDGTVEELFDDLDPSDYVVGITVEPAAGSATPTLPIVAAA